MTEPTTTRYWRYQPVIRADNSGQAVTLCECYFTEDDRLDSWTENPRIAPMGCTPEELTADLCQMLQDALTWVPVPFAGLKAGMTFDRTGVDVGKSARAGMREVRRGP